MKSLATLCLCVVAVSGCSDGSLDNEYDRYMNVFGLHYSPPPAGVGGIMGRALQGNGKAASWATVHARPLSETGNVPAATTTNDKGGFFIPGLSPGDYRIYVVARSGEGVSFDATIAANQVFEQESIRLQPLARVTGYVKLGDEPVHSGVTIHALYSPFSTFSDHTGLFYLDLPVGSYTFRAEKEGYITTESETYDQITGELSLTITLEENPWPSAKVELVSDEPQIVRGMNAKLKITPVPGVKYMSIEGVDDTHYQKWTAIKSEQVITLPYEGHHHLTLSFMDTYGKRSEPVSLSFFNTTLDKSWQILQGTYDQDVHIKSGSKVYFVPSSILYLDASNNDTSSAVPEPPLIIEPPEGTVVPPPPGGNEEPEPSTDLENYENLELKKKIAKLVGDPPKKLKLKSSLDIDSRSFVPGTLFFGDVTVEHGVTIKGGARFNGNLTLNGTREQPIEWSSRRTGMQPYIELERGHIKAHWTNFENIMIEAFNFTGSDGVELFAVNSKNSDFTFHLPDFLSEFTPQINISQSQWEAGQLHFRCNNAGLGEDDETDEDDASDGDSISPTPIPEGHDKTRRQQAIVDISSVILEKTQVGLYCYQSSANRPIYQIESNNFLATNSYYFLGGDHEVDRPSLPPADTITGTIQNNHFRQPDRLYYGVEEFGWMYGENIPTPWPDAGLPE